MRLPWWVAVGVLAVVVRLLFQSQISDYVLFRVPLIDAEEYVGWAVNLATGRGEPDDVYYKAPFYSWVLAAWGPRFTEFLHSNLGNVAPGGERTEELQMSEVFAAGMSAGLTIGAKRFAEGRFIDIGTPGDLERAARRADISRR